MKAFLYKMINLGNLVTYLRYAKYWFWESYTKSSKKIEKWNKCEFKHSVDVDRSILT